MPELHVWNGASGTSAPYADWASAAATLKIAAAAASATDTIWVAKDHVESAAAFDPTFPGTPGSSTKVYCGTRDTVSGITGLATMTSSTGSITATGTTMVTTGSWYAYGLNIISTSASSTNFIIGSAASNNTVLDNCAITMGSNTGSRLTLGSANTGTTHSYTKVKDCIYRFGNTNQSIVINGVVDVVNGSFHASSSNIINVFTLGTDSRGARLNAWGVDFTELGTTFNLFAIGGTMQWGRVRNCVMPVGWSGNAIGTASVPGSATYWELLNYSISGTDTNYRFWTSTSQGTCREDLTVYRTSGAQDEAIQYSIRMDATAAADYPAHVLRSIPIIRRIDDAPGTTVNLVVHIAHDGASAYTNKEVWLESEVLSSNVSSKSSFVTDAQTDPTVAAAAQPASGEAWTGDSGTGPNGSSTWHQLKLELATVSVSKTGYATCWVCFAPGVVATLFADPKIEVTIN